jgi:uroporphyrinogen III methyltransferase / synthase
VTSKPVVVTRDEPANGPLSTGLRELGLRVLAWPVVKISPPADVTALERALASVNDFDWITFASQHAVAAVTSRLPAGGASRIAAVGKRTAEALEERGWRVDLVPEESTADGLVKALAPNLRPGAKVLFPASSRALPTLAAGLRKLGATVLEVEAYRTEAAPLDIEDCRDLIDHHAIGAVTFTSPSAVTELDQALGEAHFDRLLSHSAIIALGPTTGRALIERGHPPVLADPQTLQGLAVTTARLMQTRA